MPAQFFGLNANTTLQATQQATDTTVVVASEAGFPSSFSPAQFPFTILVESELELVKRRSASQPAQGVSWDVTRAVEGTGQAGGGVLHNLGSPVKQDFTLAGLLALGGGDVDRVGTGPGPGFWPTLSPSRIGNGEARWVGSWPGNGPPTVNGDRTGDWVMDQTGVAWAWNGVTWLSGGAGIAGEIRMYGGANVPTGWLLCDGSSYPRSAPYDKLFAALSQGSPPQPIYGAVDNSHFNVPDLRGRVAVGVGAQNLNAQPSVGLGATNWGAGDLPQGAVSGVGGYAAQQLQSAEMPSHSHSTDAQGFHAHSISDTTGGGFLCAFPFVSGTNSANIVQQTPGTYHVLNTTEGNGSHGHNIGYQGGLNAHNNMPPFLGLNFIVKL